MELGSPQVSFEDATTPERATLTPSSGESRALLPRLSLAAGKIIAGPQNSKEPPARQKSVRWAIIDGACAEVLAFEPSPDVGVPVSFASSRSYDENADSPGLCSCICFCCVTLKEVCFPPVEVVDDLESFALGRPLKEGILWKLNSSVDREVDEGAQLNDLGSWRSRHFYMSRSEGKLGLLYISEKENGFMQLGALLQDFSAKSNKELAEIKELPTINITPISTQATLEMGKTLHAYDLAFSETEMYSTDEQYVREIPDKLFPIEIVWKDNANKQHNLILGAKNTKDRVIWVKSMRIAMGLCG